MKKKFLIYVISIILLSDVFITASVIIPIYYKAVITNKIDIQVLETITCIAMYSLLSTLIIEIILFLVSLLVFNKYILKKVKMINSELDSIKNGNYSESFEIKGNDEFTEMAENITVMKKIIRERELELKRLSQVKGEFLAGMSHEIRTPLNSIIGFTDILLEEEKDFNKKYKLELMKYSEEVLLKLINDILDISKIESGRLKLEKADFEIIEVVEGTIKKFEITAKRKSIELNYIIEKNIISSVSGDSLRVEQILLNLISNAIKFTEYGEVKLEVYKECEENGKQRIGFIISDTGVGIPEPLQECIFEKYVQASSSTTRKFGGSGLGLAIVNQLVKLMNGEIELKSKEKVGTTFKIVIPFEVSQKRKTGKINGAKIEDEHKDLLILVVEDDELNREITAEILKKYGWNYEFAESGKEAIEFFMKKSYNVVMMDISLPDGSGYEFSKQLKKINGKIPIVAFTANRDELEEGKWSENGMDAYIEKPIKPNLLYKTIMGLGKNN